MSGSAFHNTSSGVYGALRSFFSYFYKIYIKIGLWRIINKIPVATDSEIPPFFIIGSGRSGNTLLRRVLNNSDELYIPPETYVLGKCIQDYYRYPFLTWSSLVDLILNNFEQHHEFETFKLGSLLPLRTELYEVNIKQRSLSTILSAFYKYYKEAHDISGKRWGDKTPLNTFHLDELVEVFPDSQFVHIVRDPFDAISSYVKSGIYSNVESASRRWLLSVENSCAFGRKYPEKYHQVAYEDLVSDPSLVIKEVCEFLGIRFSPDLLHMPSDDLGDVGMRAHHANVKNPITTGSLGKGRNALTPKECALITKHIKGSNEPLVLSFL